MKIVMKLLTFVLIAATTQCVNADSGKGKIRTAVYDAKQNAVIKFKARPNLSNSRFYDLVAKKTGIERDKLLINSVRDTKQRHLSADKLAKFRNNPPRVTSTYKSKKKYPGLVRTVTAPVAPLADVTVIPVADATDDIVFGVER